MSGMHASHLPSTGCAVDAAAQVLEPRRVAAKSAASRVEHAAENLELPQFPPETETQGTTGLKDQGSGEAPLGQGLGQQGAQNPARKAGYGL